MSKEKVKEKMQDTFLSKKELWAFAIGGAGQGMIYAMMSSYISDYYVNILQLPLMFVLLLMLLARVWDAINEINININAFFIFLYLNISNSSVTGIYIKFNYLNLYA